MSDKRTTSPLAAGLLDIESLDRSEIQAILDRAQFFQPLPNETYRRLDSLKGKTIVKLPPAPESASKLPRNGWARIRFRLPPSNPAFRRANL
jgi:hypothetical protein